MLAAQGIRQATFLNPHLEVEFTIQKNTPQWLGYINILPAGCRLFIEPRQC